MKHIVGTPHSHKGQIVVESSNFILKVMIIKQKGRIKSLRDRTYIAFSNIKFSKLMRKKQQYPRDSEL